MAKFKKCDFSFASRPIVLCEVGGLLENDALFRESLREVVGGHDEFAVFALGFGSLKRDKNVSNSVLKPGVLSFLTSASNSDYYARIQLNKK